MILYVFLMVWDDCLEDFGGFDDVKPEAIFRPIPVAGYTLATQLLVEHIPFFVYRLEPNSNDLIWNPLADGLKPGAEEHGLAGGSFSLFVQFFSSC